MHIDLSNARFGQNLDAATELNFTNLGTRYFGYRETWTLTRYLLTSLCHLLINLQQFTAGFLGPNDEGNTINIWSRI
jgi:hypothetical protein